MKRIDLAQAISICANIGVVAVYRGYYDPDSLSETESRRFSHFLRSVLNTHEAAWLYQKKGLIDDTDFAGWRGSLCGVLAFEGARRFWDRREGSYADGFVEEVSEWCGE